LSKIKFELETKTTSNLLRERGEGGKGREFKILVVNNKTSLAALGSCNQGKEMLMPYYKRRRKKSAPPLTLAAAAADTFPSLEEPKPA
jgi:hypothetical protein